MIAECYIRQIQGVAVQAFNRGPKTHECSSIVVTTDFILL